MKNKLSILTLLIMGGILFSLHFGGASMIWPMTWGKESGTSIYVVYAGIFLTALLFPLLGYLALDNGKGTFYQVTENISKPFAIVFCSFTFLLLGPLLTIPRMSAASWDGFCQLIKYNPDSSLPIFIFTLVYFTVVYWFISNKSKLIDRLGKILLPILLLTVIGIFVKGFIFPISHQNAKTFIEPAFTYGLIQGYATMELPCALVFATIIINELKSKNIDKSKLGLYLLIIGIIGILILAITHFCHMLLGSLTGNLFETLEYSALYTKVVIVLWGQLGGTIFSIALLCAALTTAVGLTAAVSEFAEEVSNSRISYKKASIIIIIISIFVTMVELKNIIVYTAPLLECIYPPAITLTLFYALIPNLKNRQGLMYGLKYGVIIAFIWGIYTCLLKYLYILGFTSGIMQSVYDSFPLASHGFGWVPLVIVSVFIGIIIHGKSVGNGIKVIMPDKINTI